MKTKTPPPVNDHETRLRRQALRENWLLDNPMPPTSHKATSEAERITNEHLQRWLRSKEHAEFASLAQ